MFKAYFGAALAALLVVNSWGQGIVDEYVTANELQVAIDFGGVYTADVGVAFESVDGLAPGALGITVDQVNPNDLTLLARLPAGGLVTIPSAFPVKLSIEPSANSALLMRGSVAVSFHTHNLPYSLSTPLRLFKAEDGGAFVDITARVSSGSYRVRGDGGDFCEFMIVSDLRPTAAVIADKFAALESLLQSHQSDIDANLYASLTALVASASTSFAADGFNAAIKSLNELTTEIKKSSGEIPDVWRPRGDLTNVAGQVRAAATTLSFSLSLLANNL